MKIELKFNTAIKAAYLDEATKEAVVILGEREIRRAHNDLDFERMRQSGEWEVRHSDGSVTPARR